MFKYYESRPSGIFFALLLLFEIIAVLSTFRFDAILAISITSLVINLSSKNRKMLSLTIIIYLLLHFLYFIPQDAFVSLAEKAGDFGLIITERINAFYASVELLSNNIMFGVGIGKEPFAKAIFELSGTAYESSGNLILQMACEAGIFAPAAFLILMAIRAKHSYKYFPYARKSLTSASLTMSGATYAMLILGLFGNVFADSATFFLFFTVFGIGSAMLRASKNEHDEKVFYFTDTLSLYSSSLDVDVTDR